MLRYLILFLLLPLSLLGQKKFDLAVNQRVIVNYPDRVIYAEVMTTEPKVNPDIDRYYYWFNANDIKRTRGGYDGKLLHGTYTEFYPNKNLKEKGEYRYGLKKGNWKTWYINGELKDHVKWKKGRMTGRFLKYDAEGNLRERGVYVDDEYNGKVYSYDENGKTVLNKYRNGKLVEKKNKKSSGGIFRLFRKNRSASKESNNTEKENTQEPPNAPYIQEAPAAPLPKPDSSGIQPEIKKEKNNSKEKKTKEKAGKKKADKGDDIKIKRIRKIVPAGSDKKQT